MRTANRKVNRQPVRSPSPDIASKNKITNTMAPLSEVLKKSRINSHSSMRLELGMSSIEDLHRAVIDWQERYKILQRQLNNLLLENSALKKEIVQLQELLAKNRPLFNGPLQPDSNIKEYQSRLSRLMDQISRIQQLLYHQKEKNQYLQAENQKLKFGKGSKAQSSEQLHKNLSYIEQTLNLSFERMKAELELKVRLSFNTLADRFANIERTQLQIENMVARSQFTTPKANKEHRSNGMSTTSAYHSPSPSDSKKFSRKSLPKVQERDLTIEQLSLENTRLRESLERQKQKYAQCLNCKIYLRKISELQAIISSIHRQKTNRLSEREQSIKNEIQLQHQRFNFNLQDYLRRIREVKTILNNQQFRQFIYKINEIINENTRLHQDVDQLHQERDRIGNQMNEKDIEHKIVVNSLRSQNETLKSQVIEQQKQLAKLQEIIQSLKKAERVQKMGKYKGSRSQTETKAFQRYIEEAILKLQSLQQSIETTLRE